VPREAHPEAWCLRCREGNNNHMHVFVCHVSHVTRCTIYFWRVRGA
jgi:hypothetical protein